MPTIVGSVHSYQEDTFKDIVRPSRLLNVDLGTDASWTHLLRLAVAVQLTNQRRAIIRCFLCHSRHESFDQISASIAECFCATEIGRIAFY